jgi:hypothetical protein
LALINEDPEVRMFFEQFGCRNFVGSFKDPLGLSSWNDFTVAIKRKIYPLSYMQKDIMDWQNFRQAKGKNVQIFT